MDDDFSLRDAIQNCIEEWLAANGGGFSIAFLGAVNYVDAEGESYLHRVKPDEQSLHATLGLAGYLDLHAKQDVKDAWASAECDCDEC